MFAHASRIRFFCETKRLYMTTPARTSTTMIPSTTQRNSTLVPFRSLAFDRSAEAYLLRIQRAHDVGDLVPERLRGAQQVDHLGGRQPLRPAQQAVPDHLEPVSLPVAEEPLHHPRVAERGGEPLVGSLHVEPTVELLRLELDVTEREGTREPGEEVLLTDLQPGTGGVHERDQAVESGVALGSVSLRVRGLLVVPVVERPQL